MLGLHERAYRTLACGSHSLIPYASLSQNVHPRSSTQDPRKEVVSFRSLFPTKIAMRLDTGMQVDMVLGDGMHAMGAHCDRIPPSLPGVAFVSVEGVREPMRVRASWIDDDEIIAMGEHYRAPLVPDFDAAQVSEDAV